MDERTYWAKYRKGSREAKARRNAELALDRVIKARRNATNEADYYRLIRAEDRLRKAARA